MTTKQIIPVLLCLLLYSCSIVPDRKIKSNSLIETRIKEVISNGESELVLADLTDFQWDSLLILAPYTYIEDCEARFGIKGSLIEHSNIQHLDDRCLLVFLYEGEISQMVVSMRHPGDFTPSASRFYSPKESIFDIVVTDRHTVSGETWIEIINKRSTTPNNR